MNNIPPMEMSKNTTGLSKFFAPACATGIPLLVVAGVVAVVVVVAADVGVVDAAAAILSIIDSFIPQ
jgi:hypothetical protein